MNNLDKRVDCQRDLGIKKHNFREIVIVSTTNTRKFYLNDENRDLTTRNLFRTAGNVVP